MSPKGNKKSSLGTLDGRNHKNLIRFFIFCSIIHKCTCRLNFNNYGNKFTRRV